VEGAAVAFYFGILSFDFLIQTFMVFPRVKGKFLPRTGHEGPEGE